MGFGLFLRYLRRVLLTRARARRPIHSWDLDRTRGRGESCPNGLEKGREWGLGEGIGEGWLVVIGVLGGRYSSTCCYAQQQMTCAELGLHCREWSAACGGDGMDSGTCRITYLCMLCRLLLYCSEWSAVDVGDGMDSGTCRITYLCMLCRLLLHYIPGTSSCRRLVGSVHLPQLSTGNVLMCCVVLAG